MRGREKITTRVRRGDEAVVGLARVNSASLDTRGHMVLGYTIYTRILLASYSGLTKYKQSTIQLSIEICGAADSSNLPGCHRVFQDRTRELQGCAPGSGGGGMAGLAHWARTACGGGSGGIFDSNLRMRGARAEGGCGAATGCSELLLNV